MLDEELIQYIWSQKCFGAPLSTTEGQTIEIRNVGRWNRDDAGPDFKDAKLRIDDTLWVGHVEVHIRSSDWYAHAHQDDANYHPTILHVVWERTESTLSIPTLELKNIISPMMLERYARLMDSKSELACQGFTFSFPSIQWRSFSDSLLARRFQRKFEEYRQALELNNFDWPELLYTRVARALGQKKNGDAMQLLAERVPIRTLAKNKNRLTSMEALLFGVSGLIPASPQDEYTKLLHTEAAHYLTKYELEPMSITHWNLGGLRPANFPTIRIAQLAALTHQSHALFSTLLETPKLAEAAQLFRVEASQYWDDHYRFDTASSVSQPKKLGNTVVNNLLINTVIPILWSYGVLHQDYALQERMMIWLSEIPKESNSKLNTMARVQLTHQNAADSQALLELYDHYCTSKNCLQCIVGREVMNREV